MAFPLAVLRSAFPRSTAEPDSHVQAFADQVNAVVIRGNSQINAGMLFRKFWQTIKQPACGERGHDPDIQRLTILPVKKPIQNSSDLIKRLRQHRQQGAALVGQDQPTGGPFEERERRRASFPVK